MPGFVAHLDIDWDEPRSAHLLDRLGSFSRLLRFDKRGTGLSDRPGGLPDLETRMDDVRAVMDAAESEQATLFGYSEGGPMSILFAATYPKRTASLVLYGTYAKRRDPDDDYPWAPAWAERQVVATEVERTWGAEAELGTMAPNADEALIRWWRVRARASASPGAARDLILMNAQIDVRHVLSAVSAPTLVPIAWEIETRALTRAATSPSAFRAPDSCCSMETITFLSFEERPQARLKGVPGEWRLYPVR